MKLLTRVAGRRPLAVLTGFAGLLVLATTPASAAKPSKKMVTAAKIESVIDYLKSKGATVTRDVDGNGGAMLTESNNYYEIYFSCDEAHDNCVALQFRACYADYPQVTIDTANALTRDYFFPKTYMNTEGHACIELPVATGKNGISYEAMDVSYEAFIGFTGDSESLFGPGFVE